MFIKSTKSHIQKHPYLQSEIEGVGRNLSHQLTLYFDYAPVRENLKHDTVVI